MYQDKLAVAIKSNGKILRETKDLVKLPFGSEFSVFVKNLNSRRAKFSLHIDGTDALDGTKIIVDANSEVEIKRFIRNGNMEEGNAFKFIERTQAIEDGPRGIKVDDGVVRVEFWFEQELPEVKTQYINTVWNNPYPTRLGGYWNGDSKIYGPIIGQVGPQSATYSATSANARGVDFSKGENTRAQAASAINKYCADNNISTQADAVHDGAATMDWMDQELSRSVNDVGITVPGSKVQQTFTTTYGFRAEAQSHVIVLRLAGFVGNVQVTEAITVKHKPECITCGRKNKALSNFCTACGTALTLL